MPTGMTVAFSKIHHLTWPLLEQTQLAICYFNLTPTLDTGQRVATDFSDGGHKKDGHRAK